jgi:hypothetical protein
VIFVPVEVQMVLQLSFYSFFRIFLVTSWIKIKFSRLQLRVQLCFPGCAYYFLCYKFVIDFFSSSNLGCPAAAIFLVGSRVLTKFSFSIATQAVTKFFFEL